MEMMEQQASSQKKKKVKKRGKFIITTVHCYLSVRRKSEKPWLSSSKEFLQHQKKKKKKSHCSLLSATSWLPDVYPLPLPGTFSPMAVAAENRSDISTFMLSYWSKGTCPMSTAVCPHGRHNKNQDIESGATHFLLSFRGCSTHFSWGTKNQFCTSNTDQSRGEEDICHIPFCPSCWSNTAG